MKELISIIVPIYKVEKYLNKCLDSIRNQTYKNIEIILIDDGSPDNCGYICDQYLEKDNRFRVIHKENGGLSSARNEGIKIAKGKYLSFIDSDDYIKNDMIELLYNNMKQEHADISICSMEVLKEEEIPCKKSTDKKIVYNRIEAISELLKNKEITNHVWNKLYRKELFDNVSYPLNRKYEDVGVTYKLFNSSKKIIYQDSIKYYYITRNDSILKNIDEKLITDFIELSTERFLYLKSIYPELVNELNISRFRMIKTVHDYYVMGNCNNLYFNNEFISEYKKLKRNVKITQLIRCQSSIRKKIEFSVFFINRYVYYFIINVAIKIKKRNKNI